MEREQMNLHATPGCDPIANGGGEHKMALRLQLLGCALIAVLCAGIFYNEFHAYSSDAGQHYALVRAIMDAGGWRGITAPHLSASLTSYPPLSHWLAAQVGLITGSGLFGMTIFAAMSVGIFYFVVFRIMYAIDWRAPLIACVIIVIYAMMRGPLFGRQVVNNYFYAQVVGSSIAAMTMLVVAAKLRQWHAVALDLFVIGAVQLIVATHLLPAAQLAASYCFVLLILAINRPSLSAICRLVIFAAITIVTTLCSPFAAEVYKIAQSEGGAHINLFGNRGPQILLIGCGVWAAIKLLRSTRMDEGAGLVLASMGLGTSCYTLLQIFAFWLGMGSDYAIAKNMFVLLSVFLCIFAANVSLELKPAANLKWRGRDLALVACLTLALVTTRADLSPSLLRTSEVVKFQNAAREVAATIKDRDKRPVVISTLWPRNLSYGMTIGDMKVSMIEGERILTDTLPNQDHINFVLMPKKDLATIAACERASPKSDVAVLEVACYNRLKTARFPDAHIQDLD
jgi:hypothetical protein